jgi:hypothetical protein
MITDWGEIGRQIGSIREDGESGGDDYARAAFEAILRDEWITSTVDYSISFRPGREVAMNCLRLLRSEKAALYAYEIYKTSTGERASQAVWFIKQIAHPVSIFWIEEFLNDPNVIDWGLGVLDKLLWAEEMPYNEKVQSLLDLAVFNSKGMLREHVDFIKKYVENRSDPPFRKEADL